MILFLGLKLLGLVLAVILGYVEIQVPSNQYIHHLGVILIIFVVHGSANS